MSSAVEMFSVIKPGSDWSLIPSNSLYKRLRLLGDLVSPKKPVILTLTPLMAVGLHIDSIQKLAARAVDPRCLCFGIDFLNTTQAIATEHRVARYFTCDGVALYTGNEVQHFAGSYLGVIYPQDIISEVESTNLALINSLISLSFSGIGLGEISLKVTLDIKGKMSGLLGGETTVDFSWDIPAEDYLDLIDIDLSPEAIIALQSAASQMTLRGKFIFTWIAFEFTLGTGSDRKAFIESLGSTLISDHANIIRKVRAGTLKSNEKGEEVKAYHLVLLMDLMRLYMLKDKSKIPERVAYIENKVTNALKSEVT